MLQKTAGMSHTEPICYLPIWYGPICYPGRVIAFSIEDWTFCYPETVITYVSSTLGMPYRPIRL